MALVHSPSIVKNGLVLCLDAGNSKSYPGSGSTWYDLSGNGNHGTFSGNIQYNSGNGGYLIFDGAEGSRIDFPSLSTQTVCFWGRKDSDMAHLGALVAKGVTIDGSLRSVDSLVYGGGTFWGDAVTDSNDFHKDYESSLMMNGVSNLSYANFNFGQIMLVPGSTTMYEDFYVGAIGSGMNLSSISHDFKPEGQPRRTYKGRVYAVSLYNRQLSNAELLQNYNAFKGRFGLP